MISRREVLAAMAAGGVARAQDYGKELELVGAAGIGPTMCATVEGERLYAAGGGVLSVLDIRQPAKPALVGRLEGLGNTRQIAVQNGVAFVTSREEGLYLIDITAAPRVLFHYDTIELATGIAVNGAVATVSCRHAGVEFIDVSNPAAPRHLSTIRVGEAQSQTMRDGYVFAGVWGTREMVTIDARNPRKPVVVSKAPLRGFGDGVAVRGNLAFAVTGHHSGRVAAGDTTSEHYGRGHALEILDITDMAHPRTISRVPFPAWYRIGMDMWGVELTGHYAFVFDTYNGCFVVDIADPAAPRIVAHRQLERVAKYKNDPSPVAGLALTRGYVYLCGAFTDLHIAAAPQMAAPAHREKPGGFATSAPQAQRDNNRYAPGTQVHAVVPWRENLLVAAGNGGLHVVSPAMRRVAQYATEGIACDVACIGARVYLAESGEGLSIWQADEKGTLKQVGRYRPKGGRSVRQVVLAAGGRFALLATGAAKLEIVELTADGARLALTDERPGLFYKRPITPGMPEDERFLVQWHSSGLVLYEAPRKGEPRMVEHFLDRPLYVTEGAVRMGGEWVVSNTIQVVGRAISGKPTVFGNTLFAAQPFGGAVMAIDISDLKQPRLIARIDLPEHNGFVQAVGDVAYIPAGYHGLVAWRYRKPIA